MLRLPDTISCRSRRLSGAVLVGGASRRMGRPKAQLPYKNHTFLEQILMTIRPFVGRLVVVGGTGTEEALGGVGAEARAGVDWIPDVVAHAGPLAGIVAALQHDPKSDWLCIACDMPLIERAAVQWLVRRYHECNTDVVAARRDDASAPEPFPAIYLRTSLPALYSTLTSPSHGLRSAMEQLNCWTPLVPTKFTDSWSNINTIQDWDLHRNSTKSDR